jgi:hypothetical protein
MLTLAWPAHPWPLYAIAGSVAVMRITTAPPTRPNFVIFSIVISSWRGYSRLWKVGVVVKQEKLPPPDYGFAFAQKMQVEEQGLVTLKTPPGVTTVCGIRGQIYTPRKGIVQVAPDDVPELLRLGYKRAA